MSIESSYLRHFHACNRCDLTKFAPFYIGEKKLGWVTKELAAILPVEMDFFRAHKDGLALAPHLDNFTARSDALADAANWLAAKRNRKLRNELYPLIEEWGDDPLAQIDRVAVPWFGIKGFGIHVNGFVRRADGIYLWIGERAAGRQVDPSKLDNMIGGGQPIGLTLEENLIKEAKEEAGIEADLARQAKPVRTIRYMCERLQGPPSPADAGFGATSLRNDVLFAYDLELHDDFTPRNTDGEVAAFHLMSLPDAAAIVRGTDRFKFNCNLVVTDFLVRHGFLGEEDKEYEDIARFLK